MFWIYFAGVIRSCVGLHLFGPGYLVLGTNH